MKKQIEDELIDGLLTEHAAGSDGGEFMKELKERLSDVEGETSSDVVSQRSRWKIPVAVASGAVAASLVFVAWQHLLSEDPTDVGPIPKVSDVPTDDPGLAKLIKDASERLSTGDGAFLENDFEQAMADYQAAVDGMKDVEGAEEFLARGMEKLNAAAVNVARIRMDAGDYKSAGKLVKEVLDRNSAENFVPIRKKVMSWLSSREEILKSSTRVQHRKKELASAQERLNEEVGRLGEVLETSFSVDKGLGSALVVMDQSCRC